MIEKVLYIAAILTKKSQHILFNMIENLVKIPDNWKKLGHHMTVEYNLANNFSEKDLFNNLNFGTKILMTPVYYKMDANAIAIIPECFPSSEEIGVSNKIPHITIAVAPNVNPVYSNTLLKSGNYIKIQEQVVLDSILVKITSKHGAVPKICDYADDPYNSTN